MKHALWHAILATRAELDRLVAAAVGDYPNQAPPRAMVRRPPRVPAGPQLARAATIVPMPTVEYVALQRLHDDVHARVEALRVQLAVEPGGEQAMLALVLYFDEHIMARLPELIATGWPLLQTRLTGRNTGGVDFFRLIDRLLESEPPAIVLEVYYFCLASGFRGQYATDLTALDGYQQRLRAKIPAPAPVRAPPPSTVRDTPRPIRSRALYYVAALATVVLFGGSLTMCSNQ